LCFGAGFSFAQPNLPSTHFDLSRFLVEPNQIEIYRPDCEVEVLNLPTKVLGENILVNLEMNL
jgi:hypothetical protein